MFGLERPLIEGHRLLFRSGAHLRPLPLAAPRRLRRPGPADAAGQSRGAGAAAPRQRLRRRAGDVPRGWQLFVHAWHHGRGKAQHVG